MFLTSLLPAPSCLPRVVFFLLQLLSLILSTRYVTMTRVQHMKNVVLDYFHHLFDKSPESDCSVIKCVQPCVSSAQNGILLAPFVDEEFKEAVFSMSPDKFIKSPGLDDLNPKFYQHFWSLIGADICVACRGWLANKEFPPSLRDTLLVLIPKCDNPQMMKELRSIALCNVLCMIIAKVLANRLKVILDDIISTTQAAFVPGRSITDNVVVGFESIHSMKRHTRGKELSH